MKKLIYLFILAVALIACNKDDDNNTENMIQDVSMGASYANDVYYSLANGVVSTPLNAEWDLAFYTNPMSSTIMTNDGKGIELYVWPGGNKDDWESVDTAGTVMPNPQYNIYSDTSWQNGAFDQGALGHPDYGWGVYDMTTHIVYGDSIHIIKFSDGSVKKLFIEKREAADNSFHIKYANIDGSDEVTAKINAGEHLDKNLIHFSMAANEVVAHEPPKADWDLVFTRYFDVSIPYLVTGVLSNNKIQVAQIENSDSTFSDYSSASFSKVINTIGSDWKDFDMGTFQYILSDNMQYFVQDQKGNHYKIRFTAFSGSRNGDITFELTTY